MHAYIPPSNIRRQLTKLIHSPYLDREFWSPLLRRHGHLIPDPTMLTLLRPDCRRPHGAGNAMLVPRLKFLCVELARAREGLNDPAALAAVELEEEQESAPGGNGSGSGVKGKQQLVMRRTPKYSAIGVVAEEEAPPSGSSRMTVAAAVTGALKDEEDVERVVAALMEQQGIGEDASEEGACTHLLKCVPEVVDINIHVSSITKVKIPTNIIPQTHTISPRRRARRAAAAARGLPAGGAGQPRGGGRAGTRVQAPLCIPPPRGRAARVGHEPRGGAAVGEGAGWAVRAGWRH